MKKWGSQQQFSWFFLNDDDLKTLVNIYKGIANGNSWSLITPSLVQIPTIDWIIMSMMRHKSIETKHNKKHFSKNITASRDFLWQVPPFQHHNRTLLIRFGRVFYKFLERQLCHSSVMVFCLISSVFLGFILVFTLKLAKVHYYYTSYAIP